MNSIKLLSGLLIIPASVCLSQTTQPAADAVPLYHQAATILRQDRTQNQLLSPSQTEKMFPDLPFLNADWVAAEKAVYDAHGNVRALVRQASAMQTANWPPFDPTDKKLLQALNETRAVASEMGDTALYQSAVLRNQPAAFDSVNDNLRLASSLSDQPGENLIRMLVARGIQARAMEDLLEITSGLMISNDGNATANLPAPIARKWIVRLMDHPTPKAALDQAMKGEAAPPNLLTAVETAAIAKPSLDRATETNRRVFAEMDLAAMSLSAHLYLFDHGRWPQSLDELKTELPKVPTDPWGDGKQTLGYVLIPHGLPDGTDRPMVYSRSESKDGLFYKVNEPNYSFSTDFRDEKHVRKSGGQFRDVAPWQAAPVGDQAPTTRAISE